VTEYRLKKTCRGKKSLAKVSRPWGEGKIDLYQDKGEVIAVRRRLFVRNEEASCLIQEKKK